MATMTRIARNEGGWDIEMEVDLSSAAAVSATRGTNITCTKSGTGIYDFVIKGVSALKLYEVLHRDADLQGAPAGAFWAKVTSIVQATDGSDDITVRVTTYNNAATPVAADVTAACVLSVGVVLRVVRMGNPL